MCIRDRCTIVYTYACLSVAVNVVAIDPVAVRLSGSPFADRVWVLKALRVLLRFSRGLGYTVRSRACYRASLKRYEPIANAHA